MRLLTKKEIKEFHDLLNSFAFSWEEMQKVLIETTLIRHKGNKTHAALDLGISTRTLRNKIKKFHFEGLIS